MPILGAHQSIAGGLEKAVDRAVATGCECLQIFTKNCTRWNAPSLAAEEILAFQQGLQRSGITHPMGHAAYLINLASPDPTLWRKSLEALDEEYQRAGQLGLEALIIHPGASISEDTAAALQRVATALSTVFGNNPEVKTWILIETTAGQGTQLGRSFDELAALFELTEDTRRLGVCWDTCHMLAADFPIDTSEGWNRTVRWFERQIGLDRLKAIHLNDSKTPRGSGVDRHEHIGRGYLGVDTFRRILHDPRVNYLPMYLETPKGKDGSGRDWDVVNLNLLRELAVRGGASLD
ncbi:MAG: deoxyribonuclease IV [Thermogutta sp.]